ncbi:hypothetical protein VN23_12435 [Janthinobacterium sp. B9-8]|nr:hypothetical protein VN23_12435 [Janthinobacterium sp. B9-8]
MFIKEGWTVEDLTEDYGEDFFVRIFEQGTATPFGFFVQSKATNSMERYLSTDATHISYPVTTKHLEHWNRFWEPIVLVIFDANTGIVYWRIIQNWMEQQSEQRLNQLRKQTTASVRIPVKNVLDDAGVVKLRDMTVMRFNRFENEQEGANHLINCLKENIGLDISYDAQDGILVIPNGEFVSSPDGGASTIFFGKTLVMIEKTYGVRPYI